MQIKLIIEVVFIGALEFLREKILNLLRRKKDEQ